MINTPVYTNYTHDFYTLYKLIPLIARLLNNHKMAEKDRLFCRIVGTIQTNPKEDDLMKNSITITSILQSMLTPEEVQRVVKLIGYEDKARKFTVYHLLQY